MLTLKLIYKHSPKE